MNVLHIADINGVFKGQFFKRGYKFGLSKADYYLIKQIRAMGINEARELRDSLRVDRFYLNNTGEAILDRVMKRIDRLNAQDDKERQSNATHFAAIRAKQEPEYSRYQRACEASAKANEEFWKRRTA